MSKFYNPYFVTQRDHAYDAQWMAGCINTYTRTYEWREQPAPQPSAWQLPRSLPWICLKHAYVILQNMQILHDIAQADPTLEEYVDSYTNDFKQQIKIHAPKTFLQCYSIVKQQDSSLQWDQIVWDYECFADALIMTSQDKEHQIKMHWQIAADVWSTNTIVVIYKGPFELVEVPNPHSL